MLTAIDLLSIIEEQKMIEIRQLAGKLKIPASGIREILRDLARYKIVEFDEENGRAKLPTWLARIDREIEELAPAVGDVILPRFQEIEIEDVAIGNFTRNDLELKVRLKARRKEITICDVS
jgi:DNA-binding IclR family transcriptional regulator